MSSVSVILLTLPLLGRVAKLLTVPLDVLVFIDQQDEQPGNPLPEYVADYAFPSTARALQVEFSRFDLPRPDSLKESLDRPVSKSLSTEQPLESSLPSLPAVRHVAEPAPDGEDLPSRQAAGLAVVSVSSLETYPSLAESQSTVSKEHAGALSAKEPSPAHPANEDAKQGSTSSYFWANGQKGEGGGLYDLEEMLAPASPDEISLQEPASLPFSEAMSMRVSPLLSPMPAALGA